MDSNIDYAALVGGLIVPLAYFRMYPVIAINLDDISTLFANFELWTKRLRNETFSLSRKLCYKEPMTLANLAISLGLFITQSENNNEIYSCSIDLLA